MIACQKSFAGIAETREVDVRMCSSGVWLRASGGSRRTQSRRPKAYLDCPSVGGIGCACDNFRGIAHGPSSVGVVLPAASSANLSVNKGWWLAGRSGWTRRGAFCEMSIADGHAPAPPSGSLPRWKPGASCLEPGGRWPRSVRRA